MKSKSHHKWNLVYLKGSDTVQKSFKSKKDATRVAKRYTYYLLDKQY